MFSSTAKDTGVIVMPERPKLSSHVLTPAEILQAADIVAREWGAEYGERFIKESRFNATIEGSATYGLVSTTGEVLATGTVVKSQIDYALWGITWVVVEPSLRGKGLGSEITRTLINHAQAHKDDFPSKSAVIELTTSKPDYYTRFGFKPVATWGEERPSHLMILNTKDYVG